MAVTLPATGESVATRTVGGDEVQEIVGLPCNVGLDEALIAVGTTAEKLGTGASGAPLAGRRELHLTNEGSVAVTLGSASVTAGNGPSLQPGGSAKFNLGADVDLYGIVAAGTCNVGVLELA